MSSAVNGEIAAETAAPVLRTFHYLPPAVEEQRAFAIQFVGSFIALGLVGAAWLMRLSMPFDASVLWGVAAGVIYLLARSAWKLEMKAQRSSRSEIALTATALLITDGRGQTQRVDWTAFSSIDVQGGRLMLQWPGGQFTVGAREIEDGMTLVNEVMQRSGRSQQRTPSNFIPLEPR